MAPALANMTDAGKQRARAFKTKELTKNATAEAQRIGTDFTSKEALKDALKKI